MSVHCTIKHVEVPASRVTHLFISFLHTDIISCKMHSLVSEGCQTPGLNIRDLVLHTSLKGPFPPLCVADKSGCNFHDSKKVRGCLRGKRSNEKMRGHLNASVQTLIAHEE